MERLPSAFFISESMSAFSARRSPEALRKALSYLALRASISASDSILNSATADTSSASEAGEVPFWRSRTICATYEAQTSLNCVSRNSRRSLDVTVVKARSARRDDTCRRAKSRAARYLLASLLPSARSARISPLAAFNSVSNLSVMVAFDSCASLRAASAISSADSSFFTLALSEAS